MGERVTGKVKIWREENGYGFIEVEGQPDVFIRFTKIAKDVGRKHLEPGEAVEFEIVPGRDEGKFQAANLTLA